MPFGVTSAFSDDIAIDLGTANTLVHVLGQGIVIDEPSIVAIKATPTSREILAVGQRARQMVGRTPERIQTIRPMRDGVIADFIATEEMLRHFIGCTRRTWGFVRPRILICVPAGATPVERRAVYQTAVSAGARKVFIIEEPVAAAIGAGLPIDDPAGSMVVDIGGGTTDIGVMSLGGIIEARSLRIAGNAFDEAIQRHVRRKHNLVIGEASAERIKVEAGSASQYVNGITTEVHIRGRDLRQGRAKSIVLAARDVAEALDPAIAAIAEFVQRALEELPPDIAADICERGICLTGGGALLEKLDMELAERVGVRFFVAENPEHCVVKGSAAVLEQLSLREHLLIRP